MASINEDSTWFINILNVNDLTIRSIFQSVNWILSPAWSPDGSKIVFESGPDAKYDIYTINADGSNISNLTNGVGYNLSPEWSPDGNKISFSSDRSGDGAKLYTMNIDGSNVTEVEIPQFDGRSYINHCWLSKSISSEITPTPTATNCTMTLSEASVEELRNRINNANANGTPDTICLADGTYTLTASNVIDYGDNGLPLITSDLTLVGLGDNVVIERGAGAPAFRLLHVKDTGTLTLENLTLSNGNAGITHGGAVYARGALTLRDVTITGNFARRGGGVRMNGAPLTVTGSTFQNNSADREGGAIYVSGINSPVDLSTSQFTANSATNSGGGIYISGTSTSMVANDVVFTGNQANGGGAIYAVPSTLNITNATFTSNEALVSSGGAIYTSTDSSVAVANSTSTQPSAPQITARIAIVITFSSGWAMLFPVRGSSKSAKYEKILVSDNMAAPFWEPLSSL